MNSKNTILYLLVAAVVMVAAVFGALRLAGVIGGEDVPAVAMNKADVEKIVRNYLIENPEVIFEAVDAMKNKEESQRLVKMRDKAKAHQTQLYSEAEPLVAGNPKGDITIVEFFDYRCPYCRKAKKNMTDLLNQDGNIKLILKEFPILSPESEMAAQVAIAAAAQSHLPSRRLSERSARGARRKAAPMSPFARDPPRVISVNSSRHGTP